MFSEDATYCEHVYGDFQGREEIRAWIVKTMVDEFPGNEMIGFPPSWYVFDPPTNRVILDVRNIMVGGEAVVRREGWVALGGELWRARSADGVPLVPGEHVTVESVQEDLELVVGSPNPTERA